MADKTIKPASGPEAMMSDFPEGLEAPQPAPASRTVETAGSGGADESRAEKKPNERRVHLDFDEVDWDASLQERGADNDPHPPAAAKRPLAPARPGKPPLVKERQANEMPAHDAAPKRPGLAGKVLKKIITGLCITILLAMVLLFFYMVFSSSREWLDRSVLDGLHGASREEVTRALGPPATTYDGKGVDGRFYYRWYYRLTWRSPQYQLVFDAEDRMIKWVFEDYD